MSDEAFHSLSADAFQTQREKEAFCLAVITIGSRLMERYSPQTGKDFQDASMDLMIEIGLDFPALCRSLVPSFLNTARKPANYDA